MKLELKRQPSSSTGTMGDLWLDGTFECFTLEPIIPVLPSGLYSVIIDMSTRFKKLMPHILGSPLINDRGIRIHAGNTYKDTEGCILVGADHNYVEVLRSREAFDKLFKKLTEAYTTKDHIALTIS